MSKLLHDALSTLVVPILAELRTDDLTRPELIELAQMSWRQITPGACIAIGQGESISDWMGPWETCNKVMVSEHLCAQSLPRRPGWLEWLATTLACLILLWESDPGKMKNNRPFRWLGYEWSTCPKGTHQR